MARPSERTMRPVEIRAARAIYRAQGDFIWRYIRDVKGNPSTAYAYYEYLKMGKAAVRAIEKMYGADGAIGRWIREH